MKKFVGLLLVLTSLFAFTACDVVSGFLDNFIKEPIEPTDPPNGTVVSPVTPNGDYNVGDNYE